MDREFVIAAFGDRREQVGRLVKNIRCYSDLPINILTTHDSEWAWKGIVLPDENIRAHYVERIWPKGTPREGVRNSNYWKINFALETRYKSFCMLDDDMYIINKNFIGGFDIAENFGAAIPANPRVFNCYNTMGADVRQRDLEILYDDLGVPTTIPAVNFSPFFVYAYVGYTANFLQELCHQLSTVPCRGTVAIIKAMWKTGYSPVILPEQWCVCASNAKYIKERTEFLRGKDIHIPPIMLHLGHEEVRRVFNL